MIFARKKKRGQVQKHHKTWLSDDGQYKVDWRNRAHAVKVRSGFHATVLCTQTPHVSHKQWEFAGRRGLYKTLEAAQQACEQHQKHWLEAIEASLGERTGRAAKLRAIEARSRLRTTRTKGKTQIAVYQRTMCAVPGWVRKQANKVLIEHFWAPTRKRATEDDS